MVELENELEIGVSCLVARELRHFHHLEGGTMRHIPGMRRRRVGAAPRCGYRQTDTVQHLAFAERFDPLTGLPIVLFVEELVVVSIQGRSHIASELCIQRTQPAARCLRR